MESKNAGLLRKSTNTYKQLTYTHLQQKKVIINHYMPQMDLEIPLQRYSYTRIIAVFSQTIHAIC